MKTPIPALKTPERAAPVRLAAALITVAVLSGCAASPNDSAAQLTAVDPIVSRPDGSVRVDTENQDVAALWASAEKARNEGKQKIALEILYQALEISPQNSLIWSRAAEIQLDNLDPSLAESYASKSNAFAGNNASLLYRNWLIIEHARGMRGDLLGVRSAHKKVQEYRYQ